MRNQPSAKTAPLVDGFTHEEHYFIHQTRITWPITEEELQTLRKTVIIQNHPDRFAHASEDDRRAANDRFKLLKLGVERLLARLSG